MSTSGLSRRKHASAFGALRRSFVAAAFLSGAGGPAIADEIGDIKEQMQVLSDHLRRLEERQQVQQAAPAAEPINDAQKGGGLLKPFTIPGTNTTLRVGGYVKGDGIYDTKASSGDQTTISALPLKGTPAAEREGVTRLHARQSRVNIETNTPTSYGNLKTFVEGDFFGDGTTGNELRTNSTNFHIRHAYGEFGPFLAGQTWSNFIDTDTYVETIDFSGAAGLTFLRQAQFRYTYTLLPGTTWSTAVENPESDFIANPAAAGNNNAVNTNSVGATTGNNKDKIPDFTTRFTTLNEWGKFTLAGMVRDIGVDVSSTSGTVFTGRRGHATGWGLSHQGIIYTHFGKDQINYQISGGDGIGRYLFNAVGTGANFNAATGFIETQTAWGGYIGYRHWWTDTLRTNLTYGFDRLSNDVAITGTAVNKRDSDYHVNLIWSPFERTNFGAEYIYGSRETVDGNKGYESRVQVAAQYLF
ncbi:MAG TPA: DcaP family trimeric outer membrane transporter [Alphaproteobacteria bacterium]